MGGFRWDFANMWAVAPREDLSPEEEARMAGLIERLAREVVRRELTPAAILALETARPLTFAGSQALVFLEPLVRLFLEVRDYDLFVRLCEDRDRVEELLLAIEDLDERRRAGRGGSSGAPGPAQPLEPAQPGAGPIRTRDGVVR